MTAIARLFKNGGSQAVRLPKAFRFPGQRVKLTRTKRGVLLTPVENDAHRRARLFAALEGSCPEFPVIESNRTPEPEREPLV